MTKDVNLLAYKGAMRASRLLTILITLQLRGRVSARALAEQLEVSKRTIYRDIDELSAAGVPVHADRGSQGGFTLLGGFRTELTGLTDAESEAFLLAGVPAAAADLGLAAPASAARLKLLESLPPSGRKAAQRVAERFHVDPVDWYQRAHPPPHLQTIARAVWRQRRLLLHYESWTRSSQAEVDPLGLVLKAGRWYLIAAVRDKARIYRLDKVLEATVLDAPFTRPPSFEVSSAWKENVARFETGLQQGAATLRMHADSIPRLSSISAVMAEPLLRAPSDAQGWREARVPIESIRHAASLLLGFADQVEVIEPEALRVEIARRAASIVALYAGLQRPFGSQQEHATG
jgi:predicted DNA-binding transcriptional regulator YafY